MNSGDPSPLAIGSIVGETYRILDFVGQGGMGCVYKVEHLMMAKIMAMKVLRAEHVSESVWKRFRTEAQAIARLNHPNVVRIYDMSQTAEGLPYYTMDLLIGRSLDDYLKKQEYMPLDEALPVFRQVCAGLAYAHDHGIIHRDIKPGNIMLLDGATATGSFSSAKGSAKGSANFPPVEVKIVDFGIAKLSALDGSNQALTRPGEVFGSPLYMSPEQCSGQPLDFRTDMYSVGVTMFQALTGRPPLFGKSAIETTMLHQSQIPPLMADIADGLEFPPELEDMVARLLAKNKEQRYHSLADVAVALLALEKVDQTENLDRDPRQRLFFGRYNADTESNTDEQTGTRSENTALPKLLIVLGCISLLTIFITAYAFYLQQSLPKTDKVADSQIDPPNKELRRKLISTAVDLMTDDQESIKPGTKKSATAFLKNRTRPYSTIINTGGQKQFKFDFPSDFSLGIISYDTPGHNRNQCARQAKGQVIMPFNAGHKLEANNIVLLYPQLLKYFQPQDLQWISFAALNKNNNSLFSQLDSLRGLSQIDFRGGAIGAEEFKWLDKFDWIKAANLSGAQVDSEAFARSKLLQRLTSIEIDRMVNITPVLKAVQHSNKVAVLYASYTNPTAEDIRLISAMPLLWKLHCNGNSITDADLLQLSHTPRLSVLTIEFCAKLTPRAIDILPAFKQLKELSLPDHLATKQNEAILRRTMPSINRFL